MIVVAELLFWLARAGWLLAAWALVTDRPRVAAVGLMLILTHLLSGPVIEPEPQPCPIRDSRAGQAPIVREGDVERWGARPAVMTRCIECGRNVWPACRCALIRAGFPMTNDLERTTP